MQNNGPILITGAAGFIGSFLVKKFLRSDYQRNETQEKIIVQQLVPNCIHENRST